MRITRRLAMLAATAAMVGLMATNAAQAQRRGGHNHGGNRGLGAGSPAPGSSGGFNSGGFNFGGQSRPSYGAPANPGTSNTGGFNWQGGGWNSGGNQWNRPSQNFVPQNPGTTYYNTPRYNNYNTPTYNTVPSNNYPYTRPSSPSYSTRSLPGNTLPSSSYSGGPIKIRLPSSEGGRINYLLNDKQYSMDAGEAQRINNSRAWTIAFDRGNGREASYRLKEGTYTFRQKASGWELYRTSSHVH